MPSTHRGHTRVYRDDQEEDTLQSEGEKVRRRSDMKEDLTLLSNLTNMKGHQRNVGLVDAGTSWRTHADEQSEDGALKQSRSSFLGNSVICGNDPSKNARNRINAQSYKVGKSEVSDEHFCGRCNEDGRVSWMQVASCLVRATENGKLEYDTETEG